MNSAYIAAVIPTVLDELAFLRRNLLYHRFLGVDRFYIYDDGSNDDTMRSVADLPYVEIRPSVSVSEVEINPYLARAAESYSTHFVARQMLNMAHAMSLAKRAGASWMIGFDADELVVIDRSRPV